ncbi:hypothetical protein D3C77_565450 [compost metagenome]
MLRTFIDIRGVKLQKLSATNSGLQQQFNHQPIAQLQSLRKRIIGATQTNQRANDLELRICQAAVTSVVGPKIDDMAFKAPLNDVGDISKHNLDPEE